MANYTKRDERSAEAIRSMEEAANIQDTPSPFRCAVCGVEMAPTVPIMAVSAGINSAFFCAEHVPADWR